MILFTSPRDAKWIRSFESTKIVKSSRWGPRRVFLKRISFSLLFVRYSDRLFLISAKSVFDWYRNSSESTFQKKYCCNSSICILKKSEINFRYSYTFVALSRNWTSQKSSSDLWDFPSQIFLRTLFLFQRTFLYFKNKVLYSGKLWESISSRKFRLSEGHRYIMFIIIGWKEMIWGYTSLSFCFVVDLFPMRYFRFLSFQEYEKEHTHFSQKYWRKNTSFPFSKRYSGFDSNNGLEGSARASSILLFPCPLFQITIFFPHEKEISLSEKFLKFRIRSTCITEDSLFHNIWKHNLISNYFLLTTR